MNNNQETLAKNNKENYMKNLNASNEAQRLHQKVNSYDRNLKNFNKNQKSSKPMMSSNNHNNLGGGRNLQNNPNTPSNNMNNNSSGLNNPSSGINSNSGINPNRGINPNNRNGLMPNNGINPQTNSNPNNQGANLNAANDESSSTDIIQKFGNKKKKKNPLTNLLGGIMGQNEVQEQEEDSSLQAVFKVPLKVIKWALIAMGPSFGIIVFCCLMISASQIYLNSVKLGHADSISATDAENKINEAKEDDVNEEITDDVAYIDLGDRNLKFVNSKLKSNLVSTAKVRKYNEADLSQLRDFYPSVTDMAREYDENMVYDFFFKLLNIYKVYRDEYKVEIDLPLLMSTLIIQSDDMNEVFRLNLSAADRAEIKDDDYLSNFDYDKDWSSYVTTLSTSEHDIEILVQHMFTKYATETCTDEDGKVTKQNEIVDDQIGTQVLECDEGETYNVSEPKWRDDDEKYRDFLKQFLEKKYFLEEEVPLNAKPTPGSSTGSSQNPQTPSTGGTTIKPNQNPGNWRTWKQCDSKWGSVTLQNSAHTICKWGCLITSIAMQIARSGTKTTITPIDPSVAAKTFTFSDGIYIWGSQQKLAPNFVEVDEANLRVLGRKSIVEKLNEFNKENYYMVLQMYLPSLATSHYVAIDYVDIENNEVYIIDPAKNDNPKLFEAYANDIIQYVIVYEKKD